MSRQFDGVFHQEGWRNPQKCIDKFIIIEFKENLKKIKSIKTEEARIQRNLINIEYIIKEGTQYISNFQERMEYYQWKYFYEDKKIKTNYNFSNINEREEAKNKYFDMEKEIETLNTFLEHFIQYRKNLYKYLKTYSSMKLVLRGRNVCSSCLCDFKREELNSVKKKHKMCFECLQKNDGKIYCPVCLEFHPNTEMIEHQCGNGHQTCTHCYGILRAIEFPIQRCPLCRGQL